MSEKDLGATASQSLAVKNIYAVATKDARTYTEPLLDDGSGPQLDCWPMAPVVAETPAQAKRLFLEEYSRRFYSGVYSDDYPNLRVRVLARDTDLPKGVREHHTALWDLWPVDWPAQPATATAVAPKEDSP